ncbi:uncharacterized protein V3H82_014067 [Fundulus diaphanus]
MNRPRNKNPSPIHFSFAGRAALCEAGTLPSSPARIIRSPDLFLGADEGSTMGSSFKGTRLAFCPPGVGPRRLPRSSSNVNQLPARSLRSGRLILGDMVSAQKMGENSPESSGDESTRRFFPDPDLFEEVEADVIADLRPDLFLNPGLFPDCVEEACPPARARALPVPPADAGPQRARAGRRRRLRHGPDRVIQTTVPSPPPASDVLLTDGSPASSMIACLPSSAAEPGAEQPIAPPGGVRDAEYETLENKIRTFAPLIKCLREDLFSHYSVELEVKLKEVEGYYRSALQAFYSRPAPIPGGALEGPPLPRSPEGALEGALLPKTHEETQEGSPPAGVEETQEGLPPAGDEGVQEEPFPSKPHQEVQEDPPPLKPPEETQEGPLPAGDEGVLEDLPPPKPHEGAVEDLPPPKPHEGVLEDLPPPKAHEGVLEDLPLPKAHEGTQEGPLPAGDEGVLEDLPPPKPHEGAVEDLPPPKPHEGVLEDLPPPKAHEGVLEDLSLPKAHEGSGAVPSF